MLTRGAAARRILSGMRNPAFPAHRAWLPAVACGLLATLAVAGCGPQKAASQQTAATTHAAPAATSAPAPSPTPSPSPTCDTSVDSGFPCAMRDRILVVKHYIRHLPGTSASCCTTAPRGDLA